MNKKMNILCFDTCVNTISVTLLKEGSLFFEKRYPRSSPGGSARLLVPAVRDVCDEAGLSLQEINGFGVTRGPGSLTGIRTGLSTAYGFSYALQRPLWGATLFELLQAHAAGRFPHVPLCIVVITYGASFGVQFYGDTGTPLGAPSLHTPNSLATEIQALEIQRDGLVIVSAGVERDVLPSSYTLYHFPEESTRSPTISRLLAQRLVASPQCEHSIVSPFYLYPPVAIPKSALLEPQHASKSS